MDCRHLPACPGCPLAHLDDAAQLEVKRQRLVESFAWFPQLPDIEEVTGSAWTTGYRHRLKLPVAHDKKGVRIGLTDPGTRQVLDTPDCVVLAPELRTLLDDLRPWLVGKREVHSIDLRIARATGEGQVVFACKGGQFPGGKKGARDLLRSIEGLASIAVSIADPEGKRVMGRRPQVVAGKAAIDEAIGDTSYRITPGSFFQADPRQAEVLHGWVREAVGEARSVLDLYAGVGAYARMLAPHVERVVAVEEVRQAAHAATLDAPPNLEVVTSRVEDLQLDERFDVAVLNPARRGADPRLLTWVAQHARRLVYVSCGPETLARDLDVLSALGLHPSRVRALDLFPQTREIETVVTLERGAPRKKWAVEGGNARTPWLGGPSGALGRPTAALALVIGDPGPHGKLPGGRFHRLEKVAGHGLVRLELEGPVGKALAGLARQGHPTAGRDPRTARFFTEKAGLVRPFVHIERAGNTYAPLHGDLALVLEALGLRASRVRRLATGGGHR